ncbi:hypothetical protein [Persephonella sp.]
MEHPITAYIAAAGFTIVSLIIIVYLIKETKKHFEKNSENKEE